MKGSKIIYLFIVVALFLILSGAGCAEKPTPVDNTPVDSFFTFSPNTNLGLLTANEVINLVLVYAVPKFPYRVRPVGQWGAVYEPHQIFEQYGHKGYWTASDKWIITGYVANNRALWKVTWTYSKHYEGRRNPWIKVKEYSIVSIGRQDEN